MKFSQTTEALSAIRYRILLPLAAQRRSAGPLYARLMASAHLQYDPAPRERAVRAIRSCLGVDGGAARVIYKSALHSEFLEEADASFFMRHEMHLRGAFRSEGLKREGGPVIYATLHFGSPVLAYLYLRRSLDLDVTLLARPLDATNPMPGAKRRYAERKMRWVARMSDRRHFETDRESVLAAREHLLKGGSLFVAFDVPGHLVARSRTVTILGRNARIASGIDVIARATSASIRPIVAVSRPDGFRVIGGAPVADAGRDASFGEVVTLLAAFVEAEPHEWWMWPHVFADEVTGLRRSIGGA